MGEQKKLENIGVEEKLNETANVETCDCGCSGCDENTEKITNVDSSDKMKSKCFFLNLGAALVDQVIIAAISMVLVLIFDGILYYGLERYVYSEYYGTILLVAYIPVAIIYTTVMETIFGKTLGKTLIK